MYGVKLAEPTITNFLKFQYNTYNKTCIELWQRRHNHKNYEFIKEIISKQLAADIYIKNANTKRSARLAEKTKVTCRLYRKSSDKRKLSVPLLIYADICGPMQIQSRVKNPIFLHLWMFYQIHSPLLFYCPKTARY